MSYDEIDQDCRSGHVILWTMSRKDTGEIYFECKRCKKNFMLIQVEDKYAKDKLNEQENK